MEVKLKPGRLYEFSLNSKLGGAFENAEGAPLKAYPVRFETAPAKNPDS